MKKTIVIVACMAILLASCGTNAGAGAYAGAGLGGMLGSAIGGIAGGWRGSDIGTLVGAATGAAVGAAAGAAADDREMRATERRGARRTQSAYERLESDRDQGYYVGTDRYSAVRERIRRGENRGLRSNRDARTNTGNQGYHYTPASTNTTSAGSSNQGFHFEALPDSGGFKKEGGYDDRIEMD